MTSDQRKPQMRWYTGALIGAGYGAAIGGFIGSIMTYVPRYSLWGVDVTWILGMAMMAVYAAVAGCIMGVAVAFIGRWIWRRH